MLALAALVLAQAAGAPPPDARVALRPSPSWTRLPRLACSALRAEALPRRERSLITPLRRGGGRNAFSATSVRDLSLTAVLRPQVQAAGAHRLEFRLYAPSGSLYRVLDVPFSAPPAREPGAPSQVSVRLPVSGTAITNSSLYGRWRLEAHVDGAATPCARPLVFAIVQ